MLVTCPKCDGNKRIEAFSAIEGGICFCCKGAGKIDAGKVPAELSISQDTVKKAEWMLKAGPDKYASMSLSRLEAARSFAHSYVPGYPGIYDAWMANGEEAYQKLAKVAWEKVTEKIRKSWR